MPNRRMDENEVSNLLKGEMVVRVAFHDRDFPYVIPLGYAYWKGTLYCLAAPGRKTRLAEINPRVAFQVDNSAQSGPWEWKSVTGEGTFELVQSEEERATALSALEPLVAQAPAW